MYSCRKMGYYYLELLFAEPKANFQEFSKLLLYLLLFIGRNSIVNATQFVSNLHNGDTAYCGQEVILNCTVPTLGHAWRIESLEIQVSLLPTNRNPVHIGAFTFVISEVVTSEDRIISTLTFTAFPDLMMNITNIICSDGVTTSLTGDRVQTILPVFRNITPILSYMIYETAQKEIEVSVLWQDITDSMVSTVLVGESATEGECSPSTEVTAEDRAYHNYTFTSLSDDTLDQNHTFCVRFENGDQCVSDIVTVQLFRAITTERSTTHGTTSTESDNIIITNDLPAPVNLIGVSVGSVTVSLVIIILLLLLVILAIIKKKGIACCEKAKSKDESGKKFTEKKSDKKQISLTPWTKTQSQSKSGPTEHCEHSSSKPPSQPSSEIKRSSTPSEQQLSGQDLVYADLDISQKRPEKQMNQVEVGLDPGEVHYATVKS